MHDISQIKPLSEAITAPLSGLYKAGGLALVLIFIGTLLLLVALFFGQGITTYLVGVPGALIIFMVLLRFYLRDIKKLHEVHRSIQKNGELIDTIQKTAIEMTDLASNLQALAFKHAEEVAELISAYRHVVLPLLSKIPSASKIGQLADNSYIVRVEDLSASIVKTTASTKHIIDDVKSALIEANPILLKKYLDQLQELDLKTEELLAR